VTASTILLEVNGATASVKLNRPEKLNAINRRMLEELETTAHQLEKDRSIRVVVLSGEGDRAFSAGADIEEWSALTPNEMWAEWVRLGHRVFQRIAQLRQPVVAVLNGHAFGGGLELALAADLRLAVEHARLAMPEATIGTIPGWAGMERLSALIGVARTKEMVFTGSQVTAVTAARWGLINESLPEDAIAQRVDELVERIVNNAPVSVQIAKRILDPGTSGSGQALEALAGAFTSTLPDCREGVAAFRERRSPNFAGLVEDESWLQSHASATTRLAKQTHATSTEATEGRSSK
jgi:enoyl-CoA hydratase/carnithine racemase